MRRILSYPSLAYLLTLLTENWQLSKIDGKIVIVMDWPTIDRKYHKRLYRLISQFKNERETS